MDNESVDVSRRTSMGILASVVAAVLKPFRAMAQGSVRAAPAPGPAVAASSQEVAAPGTRLYSGQVWRDFCMRLADAGDLILRPDVPNDPLDHAEGYRFLTRMVRLALLWNV